MIQFEFSDALHLGSPPAMTLSRRSNGAAKIPYLLILKKRNHPLDNKWSRNHNPLDI